MRPFSLLLLAPLLFAAPAAFAQTPNPNPKLAALALVLPGDAPAVRYDNPMADTLAWLLAKLERHDYRDLGDRAGRTWLGADKMELSERENGPVLSLRFTAANGGGQAAIGEAKTAFQRLVAGGPFKPGKVASHSVSLDVNGHEAFNCYTPAKVAESGYLILTIYTFVPLDRWLADEAAYHGKFPGTVAATDAPQVWEVRGRGAGSGSYQRYNGVFQNGVLVRGSKTFHGYGPYLDGVWLSNHWTEPYHAGQSLGTGAVEFHPAGTTDVVYGVFLDDQMQDFNADLRHKSSRRSAVAGGFYPDAPLWLRETLLDQRQAQYEAREAASAARSEQARLAQQAEDAAHPEAAAARRVAAAASRYRPTDSAPGYRPTDHEQTCTNCRGGGWADSSDGLGHARRDTCPVCRGRGKVMVRY